MLPMSLLLLLLFVWEWTIAHPGIHLKYLSAALGVIGVGSWGVVVIDGALQVVPAVVLHHVAIGLLVCA